MRLRWIYLFNVCLVGSCVGLMVAPLVMVSETITPAEAQRFALEFGPVVLAAAVLQTLPWVRGRKW